MSFETSNLFLELSEQSIFWIFVNLGFILNTLGSVGPPNDKRQKQGFVLSILSKLGGAIVAEVIIAEDIVARRL